MFLTFKHRCGRYPPEVRTAVPVDGRFEHIVLSCNATSDHGIIWIEREAEKALEVSGRTVYIFSSSCNSGLLLYLFHKQQHFHEFAWNFQSATYMPLAHDIMHEVVKSLKF